jgi:serine/threonine protein kinase
VSRPGHLVAGRYRLLERIGGGGMGAVWLASDELLGRQVAVKQVLPPPTADETAVAQQRQRALREGRIAARLSHPHAIAVYDVALEDGAPWLVMEYLPSRSLAEVLHEDGVLPVDQVAQVGAQVADALAATHAAGIVHRDVKPANVLIGRGPRVEGLVKITDFGISHASDDVTLTQTGQITGTPAFLAPEVARGGEVTPESDVFSLGATLYTCLEGHPPFGMDDNALRLLHRVAGGEVIPPRRLDERHAHPDAGRRPGRPADDDGGPRRARPPRGRPGRRPHHGPAGAHEAAVLDQPVADGGAGHRGAAGRRCGRCRRGRRGRPRYGRPGRARRAAHPVPAGGARSRGAPTTAEAAARAGAGRAPAAHRPAGRRRRALADQPRRHRDQRRRRDRDRRPRPVVRARRRHQPPAEEPSPTPEPSAAEPTPSATEQGPTSEPSSDDPEQVVEQTLDRYYGLLPDDPDAAYDLTGPFLRSQAAPGYYRDFWEPWAEVELRDVRGVRQDEAGVITATTEVRFTGDDGREQTERHQVRLVQDDDGDWLVDLDLLA